jgi:UDP-N-acetylglucosamine 1-carboxyvinyltransferase
MFGSRLFFVDKLIGMGARIVLCDPHRAVISGPAPLKGGIVESPDIRAGMAMLLAALAAEGSSTIHNVGQIERGYERIDERLRALGAEIERAEGKRHRDTGAARRRGIHIDVRTTSLDRPAPVRGPFLAG